MLAAAVGVDFSDVGRFSKFEGPALNWNRPSNATAEKWTLTWHPPGGSDRTFTVMYICEEGDLKLHISTTDLDKIGRALRPDWDRIKERHLPSLLNALRDQFCKDVDGRVCICFNPVWDQYLPG